MSQILSNVKAFLNLRPVKDFVADFLMGIGAGSVGVTVFGSWSDVHSASLVVSFAVFKAFIQAGYRAALKWSTT